MRSDVKKGNQGAGSGKSEVDWCGKVDTNIVEVISGLFFIVILREILPKSSILWHNDRGKPGLKAVTHTALFFGFVFCLISHFRLFDQVIKKGQAL